MKSFKFNQIFDRLLNLFSIENKVSQQEMLAFLRISISFIALFDLMMMYKDLNLFFSASQTIVPQELTFVYSGYFKDLYGLYQWLKSNDYMQLFYQYTVITYIISLCFLLVGFMTRFAAVIAILLHFILFKSFEIYNYGYDTFLTIALFYCFVFPVGRSFSIDQSIRKKDISTFYYGRVLQIHLSFVYVFAGLPKMLDAAWWNGKSIWKALVTIYNEYHLWPPILMLLVGIGTLLIEVGYPLIMFNRKIARWGLLAILMMHLSIAVFMHLYSFAAIMIALNICAWYHLIPSFQTKSLSPINSA